MSGFIPDGYITVEGAVVEIVKCTWPEEWHRVEMSADELWILSKHESSRALVSGPRPEGKYLWEGLAQSKANYPGLLSGYIKYSTPDSVSINLPNPENELAPKGRELDSRP